MFERYTDDAKSVVVHAQLEARHLGHSAVGPEHLLLGALRVGGTTADILSACGVDRARAAETLRVFAPAEVPPPEGHVPFGADGKAALAAAMRAADGQGDRHIGAQHLVLGALDAEGDPMARLLRELRVDVAGLRMQLSDPPM